MSEMQLYSPGREMISKERERQIVEESYDAAHDDYHEGEELALAAACYASPVPLYRMSTGIDRRAFGDPWPFDEEFDKRPRDGDEELSLIKQLPDERIRFLVKAGALCAAEIDRLLRIQEAEQQLEKDIEEAKAKQVQPAVCCQTRPCEGECGHQQTSMKFTLNDGQERWYCMGCARGRLLI